MSLIVAAVVVNLWSANAAVAGADKSVSLTVLFLGDGGSPQTLRCFERLDGGFKGRGLELVYSGDFGDLNPETLAAFDALLIYGNVQPLTPDQERALVDYIRAGHGLIGVHCAPEDRQDSATYAALIGGSLNKHKPRLVQARITDPAHSIMKGFKPFETAEETDFHAALAADSHVLQAGEDLPSEELDGVGEEPWTWIRTEGAGRVFYTSYGHDDRTWSEAGFVDLLSRGIGWTTRSDGPATVERPRLVGPSPDAKPFEYETVSGIPFYPPDADPYQADGTWNQMPKPMTPEESMKHMILPEGFHAELFVAEPDIINPLTMAWDERGRLWVVESFDYPNHVTAAGEGNDRIKICQDTDGDGRAETFTIFAEHLNMPASIVFANGGIIIPEHKSTWFLKDTDGDDKADVKRELFSGWYPRQMDTHAGPNNFRYGLDNWIWGTVGYGAFDGSVAGRPLRFQQGLHRFTADGKKLEYLRATSNNTWGIGFSEEGIVFGSTANGCPSVYLPIPNRYYEKVKGGWAPGVLKMISPDYRFEPASPKIRQVDWHGGYTAAAGHALYTARAYPKAYWNRTAFVAEPTGHLVGTFVLEPFGADFKSRNTFNLLASMDEWTSPIMAEVGPDGFVWVIDWYAYIVQHNPTPQGYENGAGNAYITPRRNDHKHGRIYRIVYDAAPVPKPLDLSNATPESLVQTLRNDNLLWRMHAQRLLVEQADEKIISNLIALVRDQSIDEIGLNVAAIHGLWTLKGLGGLDGSNPSALDAAVGALRHPSAAVRRNAVQVLPAGGATLKTILDSKLLQDPDPQVRLLSFLAIADHPAGSQPDELVGRAIFHALQKIENITDRWIPDAAVAAAARHDAALLHEALMDSSQRKVEATHSIASRPAPQNLIVNGSFEDVDGNQPKHWDVRTYDGEAEFSVVRAGKGGTRCVTITSERGADVSWSQEVTVEAHTRYRLSAWVKTGQVAGDAMGALFNVHELQKQGIPTPLTGTTEWSSLSGDFSTGERTRITINMLLGGWGRCSGEAWFDEVKLVELGPATSSASAAEGPQGRMAEILRVVARHYSSTAPADSIIGMLNALDDAEPKLVEAVLEGFIAGWPDDRAAKLKLSASDRATIAALGQSLPPPQRDQLIVLISRWGEASILAGQLEDVLKNLRTTLARAGAAPAERLDAARRMIRLRDNEVTIDAILAQVSPQAPGDFLDPLVHTIAESELESAGDLLLRHWRTFPPAARSAAVSVMLRKVPWTISMLKAIEGKKVGRGDLTASAWQTLKGHSNHEVAALAKSLDAAQTDPDRAKLLQVMLPALDRVGDADAGKKLFQQLCVQCHTFNGEGGTLGPDLTGIGTRDPRELLAEIVDPNRSVEANYRVWDIETKKREYISGRLDTETQTTVELLDGTGKRHVIEREEIRSMSAGTMSIMPIGLIDDLKHEDVASLMAYLKMSNATAR